MKRITIFAILFTLTFILFAGSAHAGILDKFQSISISMVVSGLLAGLFFILTLIFGSKVARYRKAADEAKDVAMWLVMALSEKSPGGKKITNDELKDGLKELGEFGVQVAALIKGK